MQVTMNSGHERSQNRSGRAWNLWGLFIDFGVFYALLDFYSSRGFIGRELNSESYEPLNTSEETNKFEETNAYANHLFTFAFLAADISIVILMQLVTFRM